MKRAILKTVKVAPYTSGDAIDREGYLSAVLSFRRHRRQGRHPHRQPDRAGRKGRFHAQRRL